MSNAGGQGPAPPTGGAPQSAGGAGTSGGAGGSNNPPAPSAQNLNQIVTDYLKKKGFTRTEAIFRQETSNLGPDGRPARGSEDNGPKKYLRGFTLLRDWIDNNLDIYKFELRKLIWPVFAYSYIELVSQGYTDEAKTLITTLRPQLQDFYGEQLNILATVTLPQHIRENPTIKLYRENKYRIPLNQSLSGNLFHFLEREAESGGAIITYILQTYCQVDVSARGPIEPFSFETLSRRLQNADLDEIDAQEGIPGVFTGLTNKDLLDPSAPLKLGPLPMEPELRDDVRAELEEEDQLHPPADGRPTLVEEFDRKIKREESADVPSRADLPLPPSRARDVIMEMQKVRENRDRFRIEGRTGGIGVAVSACIFTFHNSQGVVSSMEFSNDHQLIAIGTTDSYIRVWSADGKPLKSKLASEKDLKVNNRKLIGHSGPVYGLSFSDSIANMERNIYAAENEAKPDTNTKLLLSSSADGHIRLWCLETWTCLCVYKGFDGPVFRVLWGPHGHYFAAGGWDKTVRVFVQDHASAVRLLVGHDTSISAIAWHPNGTYVFSASDEADKTIRMWSVVTGSCVRIFTGHVDYISSMQCSPNGKLLASGDIGGNIFLWDIEKGTRIKRLRGHGKGGISSLSFSAESNVLSSGGLDCTVRIWDVELPADPAKANPLVNPSVQVAQQSDGAAITGDSIAVGGSGDSRSITVGGQAPTSSGANTAGAGVGTGGSGPLKKKVKEVQVTPDQISAFPTKKTPVRKVLFTRMNLVVVGGCYEPER